MACAPDPEQTQEGPTIKEFAEILTEILHKADLRRLITEDGAWNGFVEAAELSSEEEAALRYALNTFVAQNPTDEDDGPEKEQKKEQFLQKFPQLKNKLEDHIRKLRDLADHLDQVHKDCTISNVVSDSVGTASGVLGLLGLVLLPFTAGASLALSATSVGLGVAASVTSVTTTAVEESIKASDESEARCLVGASMKILDEILLILPKISIKIFKSGSKLFRAFKAFKYQVKVIRTARSILRSGAGARSLTSTGRSSVQGVLPMTRRARIKAGGFTSIFLALDVYDLVNESMDLYDGAKTESAGALRDLAHKLEEKMQLFQEIYNALQSELPQ